MPWTSLCEFDELKEGRGKYVEIGGFQLAVFLDEQKVYVLDNYCPHAGGNLAGGRVVRGCAVCPLHQWTFRLETGQLRETGAVMIKTYPTRLHEHKERKIVQADLPGY
jgi:nitrite reductase/ring-hydroxylating ferredoxin subunit